MSSEDLYATVVMGFLLGLFAFGAGYMRVRRWSNRASSKSSAAATAGHDGRHDTARATVVEPISVRAVIEALFAFDRAADLVWGLFVVAMLLYGAVVAPRLRYILAVAVMTVAITWWAWRVVVKWLQRS
jgi:hypothetical protein